VLPVSPVLDRESPHHASVGVVGDPPEPSKSLRMEAFLVSTGLVALGEIGDKMRIATVALAARYADLVAAVAGTTLGMMLANVPAVILGDRAARALPMWLVHGVSAAAFVLPGGLALFNVGRLF
jgi:putative Ca2+/H+ antiporter (TMEM165/GDT1 family)